MKAIGMAAVLLAVAACGPPTSTATSSPAPSSSPATSSSPTPSSPTVAVLQASNTVAVVGLDGRVMASATFVPLSAPKVACIGAVIPQAAHVAAGKVYYADVTGTVRSLSADGTITTVATFPITSKQQMLSFAVSPDGGRLLATVFTIPVPSSATCAGSVGSGTYSFNAYAAAAGGAPKLLYHDEWTKPQSVLALTGWDSVGPIGTYPTVWATQGGGPGSTLGVLTRVDAGTARPGAPFASDRCLVWDSVSSGSFVCTGDAVQTGGGTAGQKTVEPVSVRRADGGETWKFETTSVNAPFGPLLAPDEQHVMICCNDNDLSNPGEWVIGRDGSKVTLPKGFMAQDWFDSATAIGVFNADPLSQGPFPVAYVTMSEPTKVVPLVVTGSVLGPLDA